MPLVGRSFSSAIKAKRNWALAPEEILNLESKPLVKWVLGIGKRQYRTDASARPRVTNDCSGIEPNGTRGE
jgi:hypothetical protein